jgi:hypothetical protein
MGPPAFPTLQGADGMDGNPRNCRELLLRKSRRFPERFELRAE